MRIAVLGGVSRVDGHLLRRALSRGYAINFVGDIQGEVPSSPNFTHISGKPTDISTLEAALEQADAVISLPEALTNITSLQNVVHTLHAFGIRRLIIAADLYQREPQAFEGVLQKIDIDWTLIHYNNHKKLGVNDVDFAAYLVKQITEAANLHSALLVTP